MLICIDLTDHDFIVLPNRCSLIALHTPLILDVSPVTIPIRPASRGIRRLLPPVVLEHQWVLHWGLQSLMLQLIAFLIVPELVVLRTRLLCLIEEGLIVLVYGAIGLILAI